ncbi:hypothetical protein [Metasolibacillus sp.]|uniref:hypothetical protein n=1 Tax=Metasolibacillus sp. TaxID=2703680 RepID=UPI0025D9762A|nr:hypothetical protein [Metasolibacillus sp.]MCT6924602.1 hypothetical protein [Metasolibacillus sp.]MCT6940804.1 hypothetical protein [Metasolibacillus sp.]
MTKFKIGEKVRLLNGGNVYPLLGFENGQTYTVVGYTSDTFGRDTRKRIKLERNRAYGYALPCDLELVESKITKNQRITALENEVKRLDKFSEGLRGELTGALKRIELLEAQLVEKVAVVEKSANKQRAEMIKKAKEFVKKYQAVRAGDESHREGNKTCQQYYYETEFIVKGNKVTALIRWVSCGKTVQKKVRHVGRARCTPTDVFNEWIGKAIALGRALDLDVSEFEQAVQPIVAVGQLIEVCFLDNKPAGRFLAVSGIDTNGYPTHDNGTYTSHYKIINDTDAQYLSEVVE